MRRRDLVVEVYFAVFLQEVYQGVEASPLMQERINKILMTAQRVVEAEVGASPVNDLCLDPRIVMIVPYVPTSPQGLIGHLEVKQVDPSRIIVDASQNYGALAQARKVIR